MWDLIELVAVPLGNSWGRQHCSQKIPVLLAHHVKSFVLPAMATFSYGSIQLCFDEDSVSRDLIFEMNAGNHNGIKHPSIVISLICCHLRLFESFVVGILHNICLELIPLLAYLLHEPCRRSKSSRYIDA